TGDVLVIATDATVQSHAYSAACRAHGLRALEKACPLLVPLVEEGWTGEDRTGPSPLAKAASTPPQVAVTAQVIRIYLDELLAEADAQGLHPDTLVLGCTHYPLLRPLIERAVPAGMQVIDSAESAAEAAVHLFNGRAAASISETPTQTLIRCFATDSVEKFERLGSRFLGHPVGNVELVDLGG
ncbi:MAG: aspartate/glutamate racemase family protein, partial [Terracidiphilus sp.]